jgi:hypothetical protein
MVPVVLTELLSDAKLSSEVARTLSEVPLVQIETGYWQRAGMLRAKVLVWWSCSFVRHAAESEVLIEALFDFYVDAEGAVLVAQGDYGDVAIHVVFDLNDLLLG